MEVVFRMMAGLWQGLELWLDSGRVQNDGGLLVGFRMMAGCW